MTKGTVNAKVRQRKTKKCWDGFLKGVEENRLYDLSEDKHAYWLYQRGFEAGWEQAKDYYAKKVGGGSAQ